MTDRNFHVNCCCCAAVHECSGVWVDGRSAPNERQSVYLRLSQQQRPTQDRAILLTTIPSTLPTVRQLPVLLPRSAARERQSHLWQYRARTHLWQVTISIYSQHWVRRHSALSNATPQTWNDLPDELTFAESFVIRHRIFFQLFPGLDAI